jgi:hypothetical protein
MTHQTTSPHMPHRSRDQVLLNVKDLKPLINRPWSFVRYSLLRHNILHVELVSDTLLKQVEDSPAALRAALQRLKGNPELFVVYCVCARAKAPDPKIPKASPEPSDKP